MEKVNCAQCMFSVENKLAWPYDGDVVIGCSKFKIYHLSYWAERTCEAFKPK